MSQDMRHSEVVRAVHAAAARPPLLRGPSSSSLKGAAMEGMVLSFDESQRLQQVRSRSATLVPTLATVRERPEPAQARALTVERPSAVQAPSRWHKVWHGMACRAPAQPAPAQPAQPGGGWLVCSPPVSVCSLARVQPGTQVRTTAGLDLIYGAPLPTAADAGQMVTMYRDLQALADGRP